MASYPQYRAPADNNRALADPPWPELVARLKEPPAAAPPAVADWVAPLRSEARRRLVAEATQYTGRYTEVDTTALQRLDAGAPLVVSGHQPELFHPGVWFKNFALDRLARLAGGTGVHLLIDSDLCRETSIRVPTASTAAPRVVSVRYDEPTAAKPHEQRSVVDPNAFASFADQVEQTIEPLVHGPLVTTLWRLAEEARRGSASLGGALSQLRHRIEIEAGSATLELPVSVVADSEPFRRFVAELLVRGDQVAAAYNGALAEYRRAHKLRNPAQPLPDLSIDNHEHETPFWVWSDAAPVRRPLFVAMAGERLTLSDRAGWSAEGPSDAEAVAGWLGELRARGIKVRSRALVTTLYARAVLSDLFLHGIGGAKYDQVTDRFAQRLLGAAPPAHATLSATLRLPIEHESPSADDRQRLVRRLRELRYQPERHLPPDAGPDALEWARRKAEWIRVEDSRQRRERHQQITAANRHLAETLAGERARVTEELAELERRLREAKTLGSREYSFCLFPADDIVPRLQALCDRA